MSDGAGLATDAQQALARTVSLTLTGDEPRTVVAALLDDHLQPAIHGTHPKPATDRQRQFLAELGGPQADEPQLNRNIASAWIEHLLTLRTIEALIRLQPAKNDAVIARKVTNFEGQTTESLYFHIISSIGADGLIYFKGGNGQCARAGRVTKALPSDNPNDYPQFRELTEDQSL